MASISTTGLPAVYTLQDEPYMLGHRRANNDIGITYKHARLSTIYRLLNSRTAPSPSRCSPAPTERPRGWFRTSLRFDHTKKRHFRRNPMRVGMNNSALHYPHIAKRKQRRQRHEGPTDGVPRPLAHTPTQNHKQPHTDNGTGIYRAKGGNPPVFGSTV